MTVIGARSAESFMAHVPWRIASRGRSRRCSVQRTCAKTAAVSPTLLVRHDRVRIAQDRAESAVVYTWTFEQNSARTKLPVHLQYSIDLCLRAHVTLRSPTDICQGEWKASGRASCSTPSGPPSCPVSRDHTATTSLPIITLVYHTSILRRTPISPLFYDITTTRDP